MKPSPMIDLLPPPKRISRTAGVSPGLSTQKLTGLPSRNEAGAYSIEITINSTTIAANDEAGFFHAGQTLAQIDRQFPGKRPCLKILDWPDYPVRGFYHDVTRGKVPKLATLLKLADLCAQYKLNHLELYVEHTYAFRNHPEVWHGADPLTAEEIRALDAHCARLHIDLVPSFSTFGHFYTWIRRKFPELNEMERDVSGDAFSWCDRMAHYTLNCQDPRSLRLVEEIIGEVLPFFRSRYFNICADETFDLGTGKNRELAQKVGVGRLYVDFLKKIMEIVRRADRIPLFWGDIIAKYPDLLSEVPGDAILMDWDYSSNLGQNNAKLIARTGRRFYVCPGIHGWSKWLPNYTEAHLNITRMAKHGLKFGATGLVNTDWGDFGHINTLGPTLPGLVLGASSAWNARSRALLPAHFDPAVSRLALGDPLGKLAGLLRLAVQASRAPWQTLCYTLQPCLPHYLDASGLPGSLFDHPPETYAGARSGIRSAEKQIETLLTKYPIDSLLAKEIRVGLLGLSVMEEYHLFVLRRIGKSRLPALPGKEMSNRLLQLDKNLSQVWKARNKPSEYSRIRGVLRKTAEMCREDFFKKFLIE